MNRRRLIFGGVLIVLIGAVFVANAALSNDGGSWREVERRDLVIGVDIEGELEAVESVAIGPPVVPRTWQFKISFLATEGMEVQAGQPVVGFDTTQQRRSLEGLQSRRDTAAAELEKTVADLRRQRSDLELQLSEAKAQLRKTEFLLQVPPDLTSQRDLETARIDRDLDQMEIDRLVGELEYLELRRKNEVARLTNRRDLAASKVSELQAAIKAMNVKAPRPGTVVLIADWRGEKLKVGDQSWRGRKILEIPDLDRLRATVSVAEADIGRVEPGQVVTFRLDAYPDVEYKAKVSSLRRAVQPRSRNDPRKVVKAQLELESTDRERMRPGMRLRGRIEIERLPERVAIPEEAIFADAGGNHVWVQTLVGRERRTPELGRRDDDFFEVISGLKAGDLVLGRESDS